MKISTAALALLLSSTAAFAADLAPQPVEPVAPVVVAPFTWTGIYGGLQAGYTFGNSDFSVYRASTGLPDYEGSMDPSGFTGGLYVGANYQFEGNFVIGIEADGNYDDVKDSSVAYGNAAAGTAPVTPRESDAKLKWDASVRLRAGYAFDRFLPYITGGVAFGKFDYNPNWTIDGQLRHSSTQTGWTIGAGLEYAVTDNLIARVEYRYTDYGKKTYVEYVNPLFNDDIDLKTNSIRVGIAYKF
jgi:outer membrane immunogenic protein